MGIVILLLRMRWNDTLGKQHSLGWAPELRKQRMPSSFVPTLAGRAAVILHTSHSMLIVYLSGITRTQHAFVD